MPLMGFQNMHLHIARGHAHGNEPNKWGTKCVVRRGIGLRTLHTKHGKDTKSNSTRHRKQDELAHLQVKLPTVDFDYPTTS